jgi:hypothetical protein
MSIKFISGTGWAVGMGLARYGDQDGRKLECLVASLHCRPHGMEAKVKGSNQGRVDSGWSDGEGDMRWGRYQHRLHCIKERASERASGVFSLMEHIILGYIRLRLFIPSLVRIPHEHLTSLRLANTITYSESPQSVEQTVNSFPAWNTCNYRTFSLASVTASGSVGDTASTVVNMYQVIHRLETINSWVREPKGPLEIGTRLMCALD